MLYSKYGKFYKFFIVPVGLRYPLNRAVRQIFAAFVSGTFFLPAIWLLSQEDLVVSAGLLLLPVLFFLCVVMVKFPSVYISTV